MRKFVIQEKILNEPPPGGGVGVGVGWPPPIVSVPVGVGLGEGLEREVSDSEEPPVVAESQFDNLPPAQLFSPFTAK